MSWAADDWPWTGRAKPRLNTRIKQKASNLPNILRIVACKTFHGTVLSDKFYRNSTKQVDVFLIIPWMI